MQSKDDIFALIGDDLWIMGVLRVVRQLQLPDGWVGAGFVQRKVCHGLSKIRHECIYATRIPPKRVQPMR